MSAKAMVSIILTGMRDDIATCQKMSNLLVEQRMFLSAADAKNLDQINAQIRGACEKLEISAKQREEAMGSFGLKADRVGFMTLASKLPKGLSAEMFDVYERLEVHSTRAHSLNERNGDLLADQQITVNSLLGRKSTTYGELG